MIGEFTTGGFAYASGQNVKVVAEKVQGALIKPGETFSLNTFTGQRTEAEGYIPAGVIDNGVIGTAVGGGISQFATTLYNAAYFAGMGDVTHTPHSFYISRYPLGREATVYDGQIDLAFSNDYDTAVMIQTSWTESDITVRIWGTKHVEVESETGEPFDYTAPERRTVPYGQSCSPSSGSSGYSVVNTRIIKDLDGKVIRREPFTTVYNGQVQVDLPAPATTRPPATSPAADGNGRRQLAAFDQARCPAITLIGPGCRQATVAQLVAHPTCNRAVVGSSPTSGSSDLGFAGGRRVPDSRGSARTIRSNRLLSPVLSVGRRPGGWTGTARADGGRMTAPADEQPPWPTTWTRCP